MEEQKDMTGMLDLMIRPGFCVVEKKIAAANPAAQALLLLPGMEILPLLQTGAEEYERFRSGCLYLKLDLAGHSFGASVVKKKGFDVFVLDQESDDGELQCLALAAREFREPLADLMITADRLQVQEQSLPDLARLNRGLYRMLRLVGNMSDAGRSGISSRQESRNLTEVFREIFQKAQALTEHTGISLHYQGPSQEYITPTDAEQLERAVLNILSNAVKFTPAGGTIEAVLKRKGRMLQLSITDSGSGIAESIRSSVFSRYLRQPGIEDSRHGLGLGMVLIRSAAANHGGTVLIDHPRGKGTRVTLTLALRQNTEGSLRSPALRVDYAGERDHGLIELADCLPAELYGKE